MTRMAKLHAELTGQPAKPSKYRNREAQVDGFRFSSRKEANRYCELKLLKAAGEITDLQLQPRYDMIINGHKVCFYLADFAYRQGGKLVVEDVKSPATRKIPVYRIKVKLLRAVHGIEVVEV